MSAVSSAKGVGAGTVQSATAGQHRLARIQVYNWGTFGGYHDLPVPRSGLLLTGPSGSGKSSLLDALSAVLVPAKHLRFNAAAQDAGTNDRSRTVLSYVRGAYRRVTQETTGEVVTDYLRPGATRSGIALTFTRLNPADTLTLLKLYHVRSGADSASQVEILVEGQQDLVELIGMIREGVDKRRLRQHLGDRARFFQGYSSFAAAFRRRLGLSGEVAQRLLHRTQAAKSLTSLDTLLRDFMLDTPGTFSLADDAVEQFAELRDAHAAVVDARRQEEILAPLLPLSLTISRAQQDQELSEKLSQSVDAYVRRLRRDRLEQTRDRARAAVTALDGEVHNAKRAEDRARAEVQDLTTARAGVAGSELPVVQARLESARKDLARVEDQLRNLAGHLGVLGTEPPQTAAAFAELADQLDREAHELRVQLESFEVEAHAVMRDKLELADQLKALRAEAERITRTRSAMAPDLLDAREVISRATGQPASVLPFVGEILTIVEGQETWRVAVEAVASGFARTMLVPERLYRQVADAVDVQRLGTRLSYLRVLPGGEARSVSPDALARKLRPVEGTDYAQWLDTEILRRFDHRCVEDAAALAGVERGVTRAGQVKSSRTAHLKDDRRDLTNPRFWTIGVDAAQRLDQVSQEVDRLRRREREVNAQLEDLTRRTRQMQERRDACLRAAESTWEEVDVTTASGIVADLEAQCGRLTQDLPGLVELDTRLEAARVAEEQARERHISLRANLKQQRSRLEETTKELERLAVEDEPDLDESLSEELDKRFRSRKRHPTLDEIGQVATSVTRELSQERQRALRQENEALRDAVSIMVRFGEQWPAAGADVRPEPAYLDDHLKVLKDLRADDLPRHERRFSELLQSQSSQNIGQLASEIRRAVSQVRTRIGPVNDALQDTEYSPGHHLRIEVSERRLPVVADFLADLATISTGSLDLADETQQEAEARFELLNAVMTRLASSEQRDLTWRNQCLDTRLHVSFTAVERDEHGTAVDYYEGAGGLSGGQRQKLVVFCLAAALRYQLTEAGDPVPGYALVVLDEAFDKTDTEFTRAGLDVFSGFGFQLLLATPMKMLQTLEEHVGGAAMVTNDAEGRCSQLSLVLFENTEDTESVGDAEHVDDAEKEGVVAGADVVGVTDPRGADKTAASASGTHEDNEENLFSVFTDEEGSL